MEKIYGARKKEIEREKRLEKERKKREYRGKSIDNKKGKRWEIKNKK